MSYATPDDMNLRHGADAMVRLTDLADAPTGEANTAAVQAALDSASATMDGYFKSKYSLPFAETPPALKHKCMDLAWAELARNGGVLTEAAEAASRAAMAWLRDVAGGRVALGVAEGGEEPARAEGRVAAVDGNSGGTFSDAAMAGYGASR